MQINRIGEFGLIKRFQKFIKLDTSVVRGSGDDCAVIKFSKDKYMLFTCDMIVEDVDFLRSDKTELIGRKALAVSISDIVACGGTPRYCLVAMGIPERMSVEKVDRISRGLFNLAREYKVNVVGGDISRARRLIIDVSMIGFVEKKSLVLRSGARPGDIIFITGSLGGSIRGKHLSFAPRLEEARYLVKNFKINSMIDISDGLCQDLGHILKQSRVGAMLFEELIPLAQEARNLEEAFYMGEDFELLFTLSPKQAKRLCAKKISNPTGVGFPTSFKPIGKIMPLNYGLKSVDKKGRERIIKPKGYQHF